MSIKICDHAILNSSASDILEASILIIGDQDANVQLLEQMLHEAGYQHIASTVDLHGVCALLRENHYDLIMFDLQMLGMDSFKVMEGMKEIDSLVPVLVVTAHPNHKLRALASGAKDFISKPYNLVEITTRMHSMLEMRLLYKRLEQCNQELEQTVQERTFELRESETRFRRLAELASDWYWEQDENGCFTKVYGPVLEIFDIQANAWPGKTGEAQVVSWDKSGRAALEANIVARQPFLDLVCSRIDADGARQYFQICGEPIFETSGRFAGYRGVGRDVTEIMHDIAHPSAA